MYIANVEIDETAPVSLDDAAKVAAAVRAGISYDPVHNLSGIVGQEEMIEFLTIGVLTGNHIMLEGNPGLAKTEACKALARGLTLQFNRVQFVPDMMPSDLMGSFRLEVEEGRTVQRWVDGPIFCNLLLADEINRASSKVQAGLLESMAERQVSVVGRGTRILRTKEETDALCALAKDKKPVFGQLIDPADCSLLTFSVMATMNPIEMEGTYPPGEAQLDRFLAKVIVPYPNLDELETLQTHQTSSRGVPPFDPKAAVFLTRLREILTSGKTAEMSGGTLRARQAFVMRDPVIARQIRWLTWFSHARPLGGGADDGGGWTSDSGDAAASAQAKAARQVLKQWARGDEPEKRAFAASMIEALAGDAYPGVISGSSPRGMARLTEAVLTRSLLHGRVQAGQICPIMSDLEKVARPILRHRIRLSSAATAANRSSDEAVEALLTALNASSNP